MIFARLCTGGALSFRKAERVVSRATPGLGEHVAGSGHWLACGGTMPILATSADWHDFKVKLDKLDCCSQYESRQPAETSLWAAMKSGLVLGGVLETRGGPG